MNGSTLTLLALIALLGQGALAQSGFEEEIDSELDQMYTQQNMNVRSQNRLGQGRVVGNDEVVEVGEGPRYGGAKDGQPIYIYNSATPSAHAQVQASQSGVQKQPTTVIQAQPLSDSRAERIRKARQNAEMNTEMKIVEELERSRMEDERRRADKLFGNKLEEDEYGYDQRPPRGGHSQQPGYHSDATVVASPNQVQAQTQVQTVQVATAAKDEDADIRTEIRAAAEDLEERNGSYYSERLYVNSLVGFGDYPDAINVKGNVSLGVGIGTQFRDRMLLEGSFIYGNYDVEHINNGQVSFYPEITNMDQYSFGGTFKYQILGGMLRPFVGGTMAYQYRSFTKTQYYFSTSDATSHGVDVGAVVGADVQVSPDFSIGVDYRYLWNVYSRTDSASYRGSFVNPVQTDGTPIEELSQSLLSVTGRVSF